MAQQVSSLLSSSSSSLTPPLVFLVLLLSLVFVWFSSSSFDYSSYIGLRKLTAADSLNHNSKIQFGKKSFHVDTWNHIQRTIDCWATNGTWVNTTEISTSPASEKEYGPMYTFPADRSGYSRLPCASPERVKHNADLAWQIPKHACHDVHVHFEVASKHSTFKEFNKENVMVVGDSLSGELYITMASVLKDENGFSVCDNCHGEFQTYNLNNLDVKLGYARDDSVHAHFGGAMRVGSSRYTDWTPYLITESITTLVINRGAHFVETAEVLADLTETFSYLAKEHPGISVYFRNSSPGHLNATQLMFSPPLTSRQDETILPYNWGDYRAQGEAIRNLIQSQFPHIVYLDVYSATSLRADSHSDGLHYCIPGPVDFWFLLFYNAHRLINRHHGVSLMNN